MTDVYFMIAEAVSNNGHMVYTLVAEPMLMAAKECLQMASDINNNPDVPQVAFCFPEIITNNPDLAL